MGTEDLYHKLDKEWSFGTTKEKSIVLSPAAALQAEKVFVFKGLKLGLKGPADHWAAEMPSLQVPGQ